MEATNNGTLLINGAPVANAGGNLTANGGVVQFSNGTTVIGGTINSIGGSTIGTNGSSGLDGSTAGAVTLNGTYTVNGVTTMGGSIVNHNDIELLGGSQVHFNADTTLTGGGTVTMTAQNNYLLTSGATTLTNVDNTIQGAGNIGYNGLSLVNHATVDANSTGNSLDFFGNGAGGIVNTSLMEATNGGTLNLSAVTVQNAGANITASSGDVQFVNGTTVVGGTLNQIGASTLGTIGNSTLDGGTAGAITLNGTYTVNGTTYMGGSIVNNNDIVMTSGSQIHLYADTALTGGGTVTMSAQNNYILSSGATMLTNVDNTIQGAGNLGYNGLSIVNHATIDANASGNAISFFGNGSGGVVNDALIEATNGGTLNFSASTLHNAGGNVTANGGDVQFTNGATVEGGTLNQSGSSTLGTIGSSTLDGTTAGAVSINGTYTVSGTTYTSGSIVNHDNFLLLGGSQVHLYADTTLSGGGTVTMTSGNYILSSGATALTNADNTIQGQGTIGYDGLNVLNQAAGTIVSNSGGVLTLNSATLTNLGTLQVNAGSSVYASDVLSNFSGATLTDGTYSVNGSGSGTGLMQLNLGANLGGEIVSNAAHIILNGPNANTLLEDLNGHAALTNLLGNTTASSSLTVEGGYSFQTVADFSNAGAVTVGAGSSLLVGPGDANIYTQTGGLTKVLAGGTLDASVVNALGGTIQVDGTLDPASFNILSPATLDGTGLLVGDVNNHGTVVMGDSVTAPGVLSETGNYVQGADGTLFESIASASSNGMMDVTGNVTLDGILDISLLGGFSPYQHELFTLFNFTGGTETGAFSSIIGSDQGDWTVIYGPTSVELEFTAPVITPPGVAEPSAWLDLVFLGALALGAPALRRRLSAL